MLKQLESHQDLVLGLAIKQQLAPAVSNSSQNGVLAQRV